MKLDSKYNIFVALSNKKIDNTLQVCELVSNAMKMYGVSEPDINEYVDSVSGLNVNDALDKTSMFVRII